MLTRVLTCALEPLREALFLGWVRTQRHPQGAHPQASDPRRGRDPPPPPPAPHAQLSGDGTSEQGHVARGHPWLRGSPGEALGGQTGPLPMVGDHLLMPAICIIKGCIFCGKIQHKEHASLSMEIQNFISNLLDLN